MFRRRREAHPEPRSVLPGFTALDLAICGFAQNTSTTASIKSKQVEVKMVKSTQIARLDGMIDFMDGDLDCRVRFGVC